MLQHVQGKHDILSDLKLTSYPYLQGLFKNSSQFFRWPQGDCVSVLWEEIMGPLEQYWSLCVHIFRVWVLLYSWPCTRNVFPLVNKTVHVLEGNAYCRYLYGLRSLVILCKAEFRYEWRLKIMPKTGDFIKIITSLNSVLIFCDL